MELILVECPSCGGDISIPAEKKELFCVHCGNKFIVPKITDDSARKHFEGWEYKKLSYDVDLGEIELSSYRSKTLQRDSDVRAKAILNLWINNQKQIRDWLSEYELDGWMLVSTLDSGCLSVRYNSLTKIEWFYRLIGFDDLGLQWVIVGWSVNVRRLR